MKLTYRKHAIMRMFERGITSDDITKILSTSETIASYPDDRPYPSQLLLGWINNKPIHVLTAKTENNEIIIITAYHPEPTLWDNNFKRKRL